MNIYCKDNYFPLLATHSVNTLSPIRVQALKHTYPSFTRVFG